MKNPYPPLVSNPVLKRSDVNDIIRGAEKYLGENGFYLPPFCNMSPRDLESVPNPQAHRDIVECGLGWDVTDFGYGQFPGHGKKGIGLLLVTMRNGRADDPSRPYCEKLMLVDGITPFHHHAKKTEDIICRGGSPLLLVVYKVGNNEGFSRKPFVALMDGQEIEFPAGSEIILEPGQSITLTPDLYHEFRSADDGRGSIVGEVSTVNDDAHDNFPKWPWARFSGIIEDTEPYRLLCSEYEEKLSWAREMLVGQL